MYGGAGRMMPRRQSPPASWLRWFGSFHKRDTLSDPHPQGGSCRDAGGGNVDEPAQRFAGEIHRAHMRLAQRGSHVPLLNADHQISIHDPAAHLAVAHERETAEHLSLGNTGRAT